MTAHGTGGMNPIDPDGDGGNAGAMPSSRAVADEWIGVMEAAARKSVTRRALYRAVQRGEVIAAPIRPDGQRRPLRVSARSLDRWTPNPVRKAAGHARGREDACPDCRGTLCAEEITLVQRGAEPGTAIIFTAVPARVCQQCGLEVLSSEDGKRIEAALQSADPSFFVRTPVFAMREIPAPLPGPPPVIEPLEQE